MPEHEPRMRSTDVGAAGVSLALLLGLCLPMLLGARTTSERDVCLFRLKQLSLALHNHHDTRLYFPLASTSQITAPPWSGTETDPAGASWLCMLLPFCEENVLYDRISQASNRFRAPLFSEAFTEEWNKWGEGHPAQHPVPLFVCSEAEKDPHVTSNDAYRPIESGKPPAMTSFHAAVGTHFTNTEGLGLPYPKKNADDQPAYEGNGVMPFPGRVGDRVTKKGMGFRSMSDGTSKTICIAESRERAYAAWMDGQSTWFVAAWPGNSVIPGPLPGVRMRFGWNDDDRRRAKSSIGVSVSRPPKVYLPADRWSGPGDRRFGPSSNHPGAVAHAFADGHVSLISEDIDPMLYVHLVSRNGGEPVDLPAKFTVLSEWQKAAAREAKARYAERERLKIAIEFRRELYRHGSAIGLTSNWSPLLWSPVQVGGLVLRFPGLFDQLDRMVERDKTGIGEPRGVPLLPVFSAVSYDQDKATLTLEVASDQAKLAVKKLYKELRDSLGDPTEKRPGEPNQIVWTKEADWGEGAAEFEFVLTQGQAKTPPTLTIRKRER